jgi:hypothetical protein
MSGVKAESARDAGVVSGMLEPRWIAVLSPSVLGKLGDYYLSLVQFALCSGSHVAVAVSYKRRYETAVSCWSRSETDV